MPCEGKSNCRCIISAAAITFGSILILCLKIKAFHHIAACMKTHMPDI